MIQKSVSFYFSVDKFNLHYASIIRLSGMVNVALLGKIDANMHVSSFEYAKKPLVE